MPNDVGETIAASTRICLRYAELLLDGIAAESFARQPHGIDCNHPAWCYGHLALYPDIALHALQHPAYRSPPEGWEALFDNKSQCRDDPDRTIYPPMDDIVSLFRQRHEAVLAVLPEISNEVFAGATPDDNLRRRMFPTLGGMANFVLGAHLMTHLGQVSTWRRAMQLGPAMN